MLASHCGGLGLIPSQDMSVLGPLIWDTDDLGQVSSGSILSGTKRSEKGRVFFRCCRITVGKAPTHQWSGWFDYALWDPALCTGLRLTGDKKTHASWTPPPQKIVEQKTGRSDCLYLCWQCSYNDVVTSPLIKARCKYNSCTGWLDPETENLPISTSPQVQ